MAGDLTNIAASVHQRLLKKAKEIGRPFNELLQYFAIERFLYRLSRSPHADRFILKHGGRGVRGRPRSASWEPWKRTRFPPGGYWFR